MSEDVVLISSDNRILTGIPLRNYRRKRAIGEAIKKIKAKDFTGFYWNGNPPNEHY